MTALPRDAAWRTRTRDWLLRRPPAWGRPDLAIAAAVAMALALRWPDRARWMLTWDAHMFALALERYDVNALRPHAPGYPVYVALGWLANRVVADPNAAYTILSILGSIAGIIATYWLASRLANRVVALVAAGLLLASPLVHIHAMTTNSYAVELGLATVVAALAWHAREQPKPRRLLALAMAFAFAVGVRQSMAFFLGPLVAWAALRPPWAWRDQRRLLPAVGAGLTIGLAWFLPMVALSGGLATWRRANALQGQVVIEHPAWRDGLGIIAVNWDRIQRYLRWESRAAMPVLGVLLALAIATSAWRHRTRLFPALGEAWASSPRGAAAFLLLWAAPAALFYLLVYSGYGNGPSGYMLLLLPSMAIAAAWLGWTAVHALPLHPFVPALAGAIAMALVVTSMLPHLHEGADMDYRDNDAWAESWSHLDESFPPSNTSIVTAYNFAHLWLYEPDYHVYEYRPAGKAVGEVPDFLFIQHAHAGAADPDWYDEIAERRTPRNTTLPAGIENLVLFDFQLAGENGGERHVLDGIPVHEATLPNGWRILYVHVTPDRPHLDDYFTMAGAA